MKAKEVIARFRKLADELEQELIDEKKPKIDYSELRSSCCNDRIIQVKGGGEACLKCGDACDLVPMEEKERKIVHECCGSKNWKHAPECPTRFELHWFTCDSCKFRFQDVLTGGATRKCPNCQKSNTWKEEK